MALCIRKIDYRRHWDDPTPAESWLANSDLRADALRDLATEDNKLSIYEVDESAGVPLDRVLAALAAKRNFLAKIDFVLFESSLLDELEIQSSKVSGITYDNDVNACHFDLVELSAAKLSKFGARIRVAANIKRYTDKKVLGLIRESIGKKFLDPKQLAPELAKKVTLT